MYSLYNPKKMLVTDKIQLQKFIDETKKVMTFPKPYDLTTSDESSRKKQIMDLMGIPMGNDEFDEMDKYCNSGNVGENINIPVHYEQSFSLCSNYSRKSYKPLEIQKDALHLETVARLQERLNKGIHINNRRLKYSSYINVMENNKNPDTAPDLVPGEELVFTIRLYHPFVHVSGKNRSAHPNFQHDIKVLGSQTLSVLVDTIICPNNHGVHRDMSENPESDNEVYAKDIYKSGFLYIEDTFYNDMRDPANIDYSKCIRDWAKDQKKMGPFMTASMEDTKFNELKVHLGYPQVYQHQGNCEHLFVFSDIEILQPSDVCSSSSYPLIKWMTVSRARYCSICGRNLCKWIVKKSQRVPFDPSFFCDKCFHSYNYIDGKKVENFLAFPYYDKVNAL